MNPANGANHARDARVIEQMTRWTLTMLQNVERGLVLLRVLQRAVDPSVLATLGPSSPPARGNLAPQSASAAFASTSCTKGSLTSRRLQPGPTAAPPATSLSSAEPRHGSNGESRN